MNRTQATLMWHAPSLAMSAVPPHEEHSGNPRTGVTEFEFLWRRHAGNHAAPSRGQDSIDRITGLHPWNVDATLNYRGGLFEQTGEVCSIAAYPIRLYFGGYADLCMTR